MAEFIKCPVCGSDKVTVIERGDAEQDTLTKETWFVGSTTFYCRCMNDRCVHETEEADTYEDAVEIWNRGHVNKWEENWWRRYHQIDDSPVSDFY